MIDSLTNYACLFNVYIYQLFPGHVITIFLLVCVLKIVLVMFKCVVFMEFSLHFKLEMYFNFIVFCVKKLK